jgi:ribosomal protein S18 acetylase RimI-like enzyme
MVRVQEGSREADGIDWSYSLEKTAARYKHLFNCDPLEDMVFTEVDGNVIGFCRVWWEQEFDGTMAYMHTNDLLPEWRDRGIRKAIQHWLEERARAIAREHTKDVHRLLRTWAADTELHKIEMLESMGHRPSRWFFDMERDLTRDIPDLPLPEGLEVRPVRPDEHLKVFNALEETMRDHWGAREWHDEEFDRWREDPRFIPELFKVAWDGDEVAGMVLNFIDERENEEFGRKRGFTEDIGVRRPYRRRGLARALLARSMRMMQELGMTVGKLGVDTDNLTGALGLYTGLGYEVTKKHIIYQKPLDLKEGP